MAFCPVFLANFLIGIFHEMKQDKGMFPGMGNIDPSKLSPQTIAEMTELMRTLSPEQIMKMQSLMHNAMGGFNVNNDMMEFEKSLPPSFREKMARIMYMANGIEVPPMPGANAQAAAPAVETNLEAPTDETSARLVILRSLAQGLMTPEEALKVLFS
jgi:hypothetical protein